MFFFGGYAMSRLEMDMADKVWSRQLQTICVLARRAAGGAFLAGSGLDLSSFFGLMMDFAEALTVAGLADVLSQYHSNSILRRAG